MTMEEAIDILVGVISADSEEENEALDMAVEALEAKTDGDLISRQDAIEAIESNSYGMGSRASVKAIKALPSAEAVEVVRCRDCKKLAQQYRILRCMVSYEYRTKNIGR